MLFFSYPSQMEKLPDLSSYVLLAIDGPRLSPEDVKDSRGQPVGLLLVDATWKLAEKILKHPRLQGLRRKSIPGGLQTAYPRRQDDCSDAAQGLASIEALYAAYHFTGRDTSGLFDHYYWKDLFLEKNRTILN